MKKKRIHMTCAECGTPVERRPSDLKRRGSLAYCDRKCQTKNLNARSIVAKDRAARRKRVVVVQPKSYRLIGLGNKKYAKVDICDYDWLNETIWRMNDKGYAVCDGDPKRMSRAIMQMQLQRKLGRNEQVDHEDNNRLNNRRSNLRLATNQENGFNSGSRTGSSEYKGVHWSNQKQRWNAKISMRIDSERHQFHLGFFADEDDAALAYDAAAIQLFGDYAWLNLIGR